MKPLFKLNVDNQSITDKILSRLISLTVTDELGIISDTVSLVLDNRDDKLELPSRGAIMEVFLGYEGDDLVKMGKFVVDEIEFSGPPNQMHITGRAADTFVKEDFGKIKVPKNRSWHAITILNMVRQIALENKLSPLVASQLGGILVDHIDQCSESDLALLNRIARTLEAYVKPADGKLIFGMLGKALSPSGTAMPTIEITEKDISSWRVRIAERGKVDRIDAKYHDKATGLTETVSYGKGKLGFSLPHTYASRENAQRAARAKYAEVQRGVYELEFESIGNTELCAESIATLKNVSQVADGDWLVKSVVHELSGSGYLTKITATKKD